MIAVVHKRDHFSYPSNKTVYIGRPSPLGNPFSIGVDGSRLEVINKYRYYVMEKIATQDPIFLGALRRVYALHKSSVVYLECWCRPEACHGDIIKDLILNYEPLIEVLERREHGSSEIRP